LWATQKKGGLRGKQKNRKRDDGTKPGRGFGGFCHRTKQEPSDKGTKKVTQKKKKSLCLKVKRGVRVQDAETKWKLTAQKPWAFQPTEEKKKDRPYNQSDPKLWDVREKARGGTHERPSWDRKF